MQIICPHCTTSYAVDPAKFGDGRKVRCARCQEVWLARPERVPAMAEMADYHSGIPSQEQHSEPAWPEDNAPHIDSPSISDGGWTDSQRDTDTHWPAAAQHDSEDSQSRDKPLFQRLLPGLGTSLPTFSLPQKLSKALPAFNLNIACAAMGALVFALLVWRSDVVRLMPQTAAFYRTIGMGVNLRGLAIQDVKLTTETVNNKPVLLIEGAITDIARKPLEIPRLRFIVRDVKGADLYAWNAVLEQPALNPGEKAWFKTRLAAPPAEGREIAVRFFHKQDIGSGGT